MIDENTECDTRAATDYQTGSYNPVPIAQVPVDTKDISGPNYLATPSTTGNGYRNFAKVDSWSGPPIVKMKFKPNKPARPRTDDDLPPTEPEAIGPSSDVPVSERPPTPESHSLQPTTATIENVPDKSEAGLLSAHREPFRLSFPEPTTTPPVQSAAQPAVQPAEVPRQPREANQAVDNEGIDEIDEKEDMSTKASAPAVGTYALQDDSERTSGVKAFFKPDLPPACWSANRAERTVARAAFRKAEIELLKAQGRVSKETMWRADGFAINWYKVTEPASNHAETPKGPKASRTPKTSNAPETPVSVADQEHGVSPVCDVSSENAGSAIVPPSEGPSVECPDAAVANLPSSSASPVKSAAVEGQAQTEDMPRARGPRGRKKKAKPVADAGLATPIADQVPELEASGSSVLPIEKVNIVTQSVPETKTPAKRARESSAPVDTVSAKKKGRRASQNNDAFAEPPASTARATTPAKVDSPAPSGPSSQTNDDPISLRPISQTSQATQPISLPATSTTPASTITSSAGHLESLESKLSESIRAIDNWTTMLSLVPAQADKISRQVERLQGEIFELQSHIIAERTSLANRD